MSEKLGPFKKFTKEKYIEHFKEIQLEELNLVSIKAKQTISDAILLSIKVINGNIYQKFQCQS